MIAVALDHRQRRRAGRRRGLRRRAPGPPSSGSASSCVGFVLPVLLNFVKSTASFYLAGLCSVVGMLCLRHFILYAGQIFGL